VCGITGKLNFDRHEPVDSRLVRRMTDAIAHRGPDGEGQFVEGEIGLGHRRLSIIDLDSGAQPMCNEDGSVWTVFNGEIYNFKELRGDLELRGHCFKSVSDTEVIVHAYEEYGDACVEHFTGMFAFAIWDQRRRHLLLARDRVGIKPLYYVNTGRSLVFGSEIKSILADPTVRRELDWAMVDRFITYYYLPGQQTLFAGIKKLEPGHYLTAEGGLITKTQYWDLSFAESPAPRSLKDSADELRTLLHQSVRDHMISDVPVGVLLSGGVDSSGVLACAAKQVAEPLHTFTVGFDGKDIADERPYARLAASAFDARHHEMTVSAQQFQDFLPRYVRHMEEPVCEPPAVALYFVSKLARDTGVKVLLSGEGGDEAFAGYQDYRNLVAFEGLKAAFGPAKGVMTAGFKALHVAGWHRGAHYSALCSRDLIDYYFSRTSTPTTAFNRLKHRLYQDDVRRQLAHLNGDDPTRQLLCKVANQPLLNQLLYVDTKSWLPDDLLLKADKMTMAASVELRVPLLDHRILEFAASLPHQHKMRGWSLKRVLRTALQDMVPAPILTRKKAGFPVPYARWMRGQLFDFIHATLMAESSFCSTYLSREVVDELLNLHRSGDGFAKEVFSLLVLELWYQQFAATTSTEMKAAA
jgi:asparagine synthase (glutamine-hydrolysing)